MAGSATFFTTQAENVSYAKDIVPYLIDNKVRLSITNENTGLMNAKLTEVDAIWAQHEDPLQKGNEIINEKTVKRIDEMLDILEDVYDDIPQSALTEDDKKKTRIFDNKPRGERQEIKTVPFVNLLPESSATIEITCRVEKDNTRASLHKDADLIEACYKIGDKADEPTTPADCTTTITFTRAKFRLKLDLANATKRIFMYVRWKNTVDVEKSSGWSRMENAVITD